MLITLAMSLPARIAITLLAGVLAFYGVVLFAHGLGKYRRRMRKTLWHRVRMSHLRVLAGLRSMAKIFTDLPEHPIELSSHATQLLDSEARVASSLLKFHRQHSTMSRERQARRLRQFLTRLENQEARFEKFELRVLRSVSDQMRQGVVAPPHPGRSYRAVFNLLSRRPPEALWPAMEKVLALGVSLRVQDIKGHWHQVPLRFSGGCRAGFSRKYLERAVALRVVIGQEKETRESFLYEVQHRLPVKPMRPVPHWFRWISTPNRLATTWAAMRSGAAR